MALCLVQLAFAGRLADVDVQRLEAAGHAIALSRCGQCHNVEAGEAALAVPQQEAPAFLSIARSQPDLFEGVLLRPSNPFRDVQVPQDELAPLRAWLARLAREVP